MKTQYLEFIKRQVGIDASKLSVADLKKLCIYVLQSLSLETPRLAQAKAEELKLIIS